MGCRLEKARQWAVRMTHEASLHEDNCFVTLTYADENLPAHGSLCKRDVQLFMKRLRKKYDHKIRFFCCGEYGDETERPHYHVILFGHNFDDRYPWAERKGHTVYRSDDLESLWKVGHSEIGTVTNASAKYVARYALKKVSGRSASEFYRRIDPETGEEINLEPPFGLMSRRPGIGYGWLEKYGEETYRTGTVIIDGKEVKAPEYYDMKYEEVDPERMNEIRIERSEAINKDDSTDDRLAVREKVARARLRTFSRRTL